MNAGKARIRLTRRARSTQRRLDATARKLINQFVHVLRRCQYDSSEIIAAVTTAARAEMQGFPQGDQSARRELRDAPHVMSVWHTDPLYTDERGRPLPLRVHGPAPSFESLLRRVNRARRLDMMLNYLLRAGAVEKARGRLVARTRWVSLRGMPHEASVRSLRGLQGILANYEHNLLSRDDAQSWFEYTAENDHFPRSRERALVEFYMRDCMACLRRVDAFMLRCEQEREPGEPTMRVGFGMYHCQDQDPALQQDQGKRGRRAKEGVGNLSGVSRERRSRTIR